MFLIPRATEKAYSEQTKNTYIFNLDEKGSKQSIKEAVEKQYNVSVEDVRVLTRKGKKTRFSKGKHAYPGTTFRRDKKIAYVTLKKGDKIRVFEEPEEVKESQKVKEVKEKGEK